ncbi:leucine-rich repeats and immunoglobulin-like domains protein 1 [Megalobrama amblycephala]|uniref:leucine-rich repeats and immunoglobulin-like domains protein 1 n=1 Tax=Megalobrama amblycephala TaxID=75352 RepID=UPI0020140F64|nr:leucine-rich repeats and immunoglobulin-like domains protein 1 [Megalobrama amblycephala]
MAAWLGQMGSLSYHVFYWLLTLELLINYGAPCPQNCTCTLDTTDCSRLDMTDVPQDLPKSTVHLNLSHNKLTAVDMDILSNLPNLREVRFDHNELTSIPSFGDAAATVVTLFLHHNKIRRLEGSLLQNFSALETLDLSNNDITELRENCFPSGLQIKDLHLSSNKIVHLEFGAFKNLAGSLQILRLSRNRLTHLPVKGLELPKLTQLELSRNRLRLIEGLTFQGLSSLEVLKLQRNNISKLTDGAFWGLARMRVLHLDYNSLQEVNSGSLYGLESLVQLYLSNNSISNFNPEGWGFCERLRELNLSYNNLTKLSEGSFAKLVNLISLRLGHNSISHITEGAFRGLSSLRTLELDHNDISGTIEDTNGAFTGLENLNKLTLFGNKIKSVAKKAFSGLEALEHLNLGENAIRSIQPEAFSKMKNLRYLHIQSDSFLCDCQLHWFPEWLVTRGLQPGVQATCAHPESLKGTSIYQAPPQSFVCDDLPKPQITVHPVTTPAVLGKDVRLTCTAASSSSSPMTFTWRKDQETLRQAEVENFAHVRASDGGVMEYTTILHLRHVTFNHEGRYQCIISNHFGSSYSNKARVTVNVLPSFVKTPRDITIRTGTKARLECAAEGHPTPQVAWQKDGGTDFPAARERRMRVMPDDDVFFIMDVKPEDMGVYSCTAKNTAGMISANVTLTVLETPHLAQEMEDRNVVVGETVALQCKALGSPPPRITWLKGEEPLRPSDRHHFTPGNQLLVIVTTILEDAGRYTCVMSNTLGTERAHCQLNVYERFEDCAPFTSPSTVTVGIIVIAVVTSIVVTSLVWVCIIYQTRKKSEECSVNTDETIVPPDVPSYLSSQGTLSERQDVCIRVESNGGSQPNGRIENNGYDGPVVCTDCLENGTSYSKHCNYLPHGIAPPSGLEYQQTHQTSTFTSHNTGEPHCNGTPNGVRKDSSQTPIFPTNHDRVSISPSSHQYNDRKGLLVNRSDTPPSLEETYHRPVKLLSGDCDIGSELTQTLLPNGHAHTPDATLSESESFERASD